MHKPTKTAGKAGDTVTLIVSRSYEAVKASAPDTNPNPGKLNYQAKPRKAAKPEARRPELVEKKIYGRARYIGDGTRLTAFVWLDEESAPQGEAGNDPK